MPKGVFASEQTIETTKTIKIKKAISFESLGFLFISGFIFYQMGKKMGGIHLINTMMNTSYDLLFQTAFFILSIAVLAGAFSELLTEFGIVAACNKILSPLIKPIFGLPGASMIGIFTTYLSDNPAILTFAQNTSVRKYFKRYQLPALTNIGTAFGMGMIVSAFVAGIKGPNGENFLTAVLIGNIAAVIGAVFSTRTMLFFSAKYYGKELECDLEGSDDFDIFNYRKIREGGIGSRIMSAALEGGKSGVDLGIAIIPGILIITTMIIMITNGPSESGFYTGEAYEGIGLLPYLGEKINFILKPLFGFSNPECVVIPITALGAAGAAISMIPNLVQKGVANAHDIAIFTSMCMFYSGYLCTHVAMMESLNERRFAGTSILCHTFGGIVAGVAANLIYKLWIML